MELSLEESNWLLGMISDELDEISHLLHYESYKTFLINFKEKIKKERLMEARMNRIEIRKKIQKAGKEFHESIKNNTLQNIASEFMALNEYSAFVHQGEDETYGTLTILHEGFLTNQKKWIRKLDRGD